MKNEKTIILDMDDVLVVCAKKMLQWINETYQTDIQFEQITDWNAVPRYIARKLHISLEEADVLYQKVYDQEGFFASLEPVKGAIEGPNILRAMGFNISIATKAPWTSPYATMEKYNCLQTNYPGNNFKFFVTGNKEDVYGDFIVDDAPHNLEAAFKAGKKTICMNQPWNKDSANDAFIHHRVDTWEEIIEFFEDIADVKKDNFEDQNNNPEYLQFIEQSAKEVHGLFGNNVVYSQY